MGRGSKSIERRAAPCVHEGTRRPQVGHGLRGCAAQQRTDPTDKAVRPPHLHAFDWVGSRFNAGMSSSPLLSRGFRLLAGDARRRAVCAGVAMGMMSWALARFGVRSEYSSAMALLMVVCGGASFVFVELEWDIRRRRAAMLTSNRWRDLVCIQGLALLTTVQCVQALT